MNFLEIAKRVRQEVGYSGVGPASVEAQTGAYGKVVDWVKTALQEIELTREQWRFAWATFNAPLIEGQYIYDLEQGWGIKLRSLASDPIYVYRTADGVRSRYFVYKLDWATFRQIPQTTAKGMPSYFALSPDRKIHFNHAPQAGLTLVLDYYQAPQVLVDNGDVPRLPVHYHMAIVWKAVMLAAGHDENPFLLQVAAKEFKDIMARMERTELPDLSYWTEFA